jgi:diaminohydroxyphosphoribosylaminopyrimidine deaminase/5-amino-6-(5-phosphoribosylamino)uracil reductase
MPATDPSFSIEDTKWMKKALKLARKGLGYVSPNPLVGCVIVSAEGRQIGKGYHQRFGQAHAEINALNSIRKADEPLLKGATVYVTLEPCSHTGKTPACAKKLAELPLKRVVVALRDPNPVVNGRGMELLRKAGIQVDSGLMEREAREQNEHFIHYIKTGKPFVTLKLAQTLDGYIAAPDGSSQWVTGTDARKMVHQWRSEYDAVMVGRNTVLNDNPRLTVRHVDGRQPRRIIIDGPLELPKEMHVFSDQYEERSIIITHNREKYQAQADPMLNIMNPEGFQGKTLLVGRKDGHSDLNEALYELAAQDVASILVEPGSDLARALIRDNLADKLELFIAPKLLGGGTRSVLGLGIERMAEALSMKRMKYEPVGEDLRISAYF